MPKITLRSPITILITMEGLATSPMGCYGCSWNQTPAIDALAADGVVWDRWTSPIDRAGALINRWLADSRGVIDRFQKQSDAVFVTDDSKLELPEDAFGFRNPIRLGFDHRDAPAETIEETVLAQTFAAAIQNTDVTTKLVWLHSSAFRDHWDAPIDQEPEAEERQEPIEEDSDDSQTLPTEPFRLAATTKLPALELAPGDDPDLMFAWMNRYAAQVRLLDEMIGLLVDEMQNRRPIILLAGASGFSLGENGWVGHQLGPLRSQDIRLPMLVSSGGPLRVPTLQSAFGLPSLVERIAQRKSFIDPGEWCKTDDPFSPAVQTESDRVKRAVTTSMWYYVRETNESGLDEERLFLKPDDVNDVNDVSRLRREVVDDLARETEH